MQNNSGVLIVLESKEILKKKKKRYMPKDIRAPRDLSRSQWTKLKKITVK